MVHVAAMSLIVAVLAALVAGALAGAYAGIRVVVYISMQPKYCRSVIRRIHMWAHKDAISCPCCDAIRMDEEAVRRREMRRAKLLDVLAHARMTRDGKKRHVIAFPTEEEARRELDARGIDVDAFLARARARRLT